MASQALMCDKKAFPKPCPSEAPLTKPAISVTFKKAGTLLQKKATKRVLHLVMKKKKTFFFCCNFEGLALESTYL